MKTLNKFETGFIVIIVIAILILAAHDYSIALSAHDYALNEYHGWYKSCNDARALGLNIADTQALNESIKELAFQMIDAGYKVTIEIDGTSQLLSINDHAGHSYNNLYINGQLTVTNVKTTPIF